MKKYLLASAALLAITAGAQTPATTNLVVEEENGTRTVYATSDIKAVVFEEMPEYVNLTALVEAMYTPAANLGIYELTLGTAIPDAGGNPVKVGDIILTATLTAPLSEDRRNAILPDGFYRVGNGSAAFTFDASKTAVYTRTAEGSDGVSAMPCIGGSIDVKIIDGKYDIRAEVTTFDGNMYNLAYEGSIPFILSAAGYEGFTEDLDISFEGCQGRYYGNWFRPFCDDMTLQLYTGDFNADGQQISGYWYNIYVNMPKVDYGVTDQTPKLIDGVYTIDPRKDIRHSTHLPFTCEVGQSFEEFGMIMNVGTVLSYTDPEGDNRVGMAESGTMTVSEDGTNIVLDFYTADGVRIGGTFEGAPDIFNFSNNSNAPKRPYTTLTADRPTDFTTNTVAIYFKDDAIVQGTSTHTLWIMDSSMEQGDYMQFTYISDENTSLPDGTYTIGLPAKPFDLLPGELDYGLQPIFSWYANLDLVDENGAQLIQAPLTSGTMTVADADKPGYKTFTFNFKDDGGNAITGTITVPCVDGDSFYEAPRKLLRR